MRSVIVTLAIALSLMPVQSWSQTIVPSYSHYTHLTPEETAKISLALTRNKYRLVMSEDSSICQPVLHAYQAGLTKVETLYRNGLKQNLIWNIGDTNEDVPTDFTLYEQSMPYLFEQQGLIPAPAIKSNLDVRRADIFNDGKSENILLSHESAGSMYFTQIAILKSSVNPTDILTDPNTPDPFQTTPAGNPLSDSTISQTFIQSGLNLSADFGPDAEKAQEYPPGSGIFHIEDLGYQLTKWPNFQNDEKLYDASIGKTDFLSKKEQSYIIATGNFPVAPDGTINIFKKGYTFIVLNGNTDILAGANATSTIVVYDFKNRIPNDLCYIKLSQK